MNNRAYSMLTIKSVHEDTRIIRGTATTPTVDRMGDIIEPLGVTFKNPLPLLWQHKHDQPIGSVIFDTPTKDGIDFEAEIADLDEPGILKDRLTEAWQSIKLKLVRAVSIGFREIEYAFMETGGIHFLKTEVYELSAVTIPANPDAVLNLAKRSMALRSLTDPTDIDIIKALDAEARLREGIPEPEIPSATEATVVFDQKKLPVVKLGSSARERAPFVITKVHPERKRA